MHEQLTPKESNAQKSEKMGRNMTMFRIRLAVGGMSLELEFVEHLGIKMHIKLQHYCCFSHTYISYMHMFSMRSFTWK